MSEEKDNLEFWNSVQETNPDYVKNVEYGTKVHNCRRLLQAQDGYEHMGAIRELLGLEGY